MKLDLYTKVVLTVIATMFTVIACSDLATPRAAVHAEGSGRWLVSATPDGFITFDALSGRVDKYQFASSSTGRLTETLVFSKGIDAIQGDSQKTRERINLGLNQQLAFEAAEAKKEADWKKLTPTEKTKKIFAFAGVPPATTDKILSKMDGAVAAKLAHDADLFPRDAEEPRRTEDARGALRVYLPEPLYNEVRATFTPR